MELKIKIIKMYSKGMLDDNRKLDELGTKKRSSIVPADITNSNHIEFPSTSSDTGLNTSTQRQNQQHQDLVSKHEF